eukprot:Skav203318  [mRNA]  locus=scaffold1007:176842:180555:- [translate_table: standard]
MSEVETSEDSDSSSTDEAFSDADVSKQSELQFGSDFALGRVPRSMRYSWASMAIEQVAQGGCIAVVVIGAQLGHKMSRINAFLAVIIGNSILAATSHLLMMWFAAAICIGVGVIGCREGMTTVMLGRWTGFGVIGTGILSVAIAGSLVGWFGIQAEIAGEGLQAALRMQWPWLWTVLNGILVTIVAAFGFHYIVGVAWVTGPAFFIVLIWACAASLQDPKLVKQEASAEMSLLKGTGIVVGGYIDTSNPQVGSIVVSDVFRFSRSKRAVISQVMLPRSLSIVSYMIIGVLVAQACGSDDVITIMNQSVGIGAVVIVVAGEMVINCTNLYFSGLAILAFFDACGCRIPRPFATIVCGIIGTVCGSMGILKRFINFLELLAVAFPPIAGIMCCEYFLVKAFRAKLEDPFRAETRSLEVLPESAPAVVPLSLFAWLVASLLGYFVHQGMPYLYSFFGAAAIYAGGTCVGLQRKG